MGSKNTPVSRVVEYDVQGDIETNKSNRVVEDIESLSSTITNTDDDKNPFKNPEIAKYWSGVYEKAQYECRHLFDPHFTWTKAEERKLVWKLEYRVTLLACFMFVGLQIDRGNLAQAVSDNMLNDLGLTTKEFNNGNTISRICFLVAELPSGIISKAIGPDLWLPIQMIIWSIVAASQAALSGKKSFYTTRALIALLEGGFIPDMVLWLSYFFTSSELSTRLAYFWTSLSLCDIFTALLAFALLRMRGVSGLAGWRWLFLIEGLFTLLIGILSYFLMVPSAVQTKRPWNKKGWFSDREEKIVVNRVLRDDPSKGDMHNRQALTLNTLWKSITDFDLWPIYLIGLLAFIPQGTVNSYLTLTLKGMGFSTFDTNLMTIPASFLHIITLLTITKLSEVFKHKSYIILINPVWTIPCLAALRWWNGTFNNKWGTWILVTVLLSVPYIHAINVSWCSRNSNSIRTRAVSACLYNMFVQLGGVCSSQIYQPSDKPYYHKGNQKLLAISLATLVLMLGTKIYYVARNRYKSKKWDNLTDEQKASYIHTTKDEGTRRLDFRFAH
ncbi:hypothetical protein WICANDRAFT_34521 [Wickerhamomyces anomalus NRRL Y-366-8]|uniref:Major facilitator superfamily (MFS) profile domain-containing protein n=1 Tax=Wickerhamomyces anomalus (strain ATCC 58044 / CBS 1984 / NCYC 433 / NRRL Y-366-8) TaxID=683960 RepID=A0A1E3NZ85_WICAA|nr:uncharacterized protein WICANDRAFT_34521 [Wickerhamomyces anomalus NRRL Y-366-8]ODQ58551.1 hypothetical protein WICANDRAFT_34521 [Wickerhamomyces anomalus NRRL Y-366-8]